MAAIAGAGGTLLAAWGVELFARTSPAVVASGREQLRRDRRRSAGRRSIPRVLLFALGATLGHHGAVRARAGARGVAPELAAALKEDERGGGRRGRALGVLVVSEVALACMLLDRVGTADRELRPHPEPAHRVRRRQRVDVLGAAAGLALPAGGGPATLDRLLDAHPGGARRRIGGREPLHAVQRLLAHVVFLPDRPADRADAPGVGRHYVSADYFRTLGIPLLAGRTLTAADRAGSPPVAVVNEAGARRFWPGENAIGKRVWFGTTTGPFSDPAHAVEIVGVVGDVKYEGVEQADGPTARISTRRICSSRIRTRW